MEFSWLNGLIMGVPCRKLPQCGKAEAACLSATRGSCRKNIDKLLSLHLFLSMVDRTWRKHQRIFYLTGCIKYLYLFALHKYCYNANLWNLPIERTILASRGIFGCLPRGILLMAEPFLFTPQDLIVLQCFLLSLSHSLMCIHGWLKRRHQTMCSQSNWPA